MTSNSMTGILLALRLGCYHLLEPPTQLSLTLSPGELTPVDCISQNPVSLASCRV